MSLTEMSGKVTTKGQITIPLALRDRLGIHPGATVEFSVEGEAIVVRKHSGPETGRGAHLVARLRGTATAGLSTDEIMELTRE